MKLGTDMYDDPVAKSGISSKKGDKRGYNNPPNLTKDSVCVQFWWAHRGEDMKFKLCS